MRGLSQQLVCPRFLQGGGVKQQRITSCTLAGREAALNPDGLDL